MLTGEPMISLAHIQEQFCLNHMPGAPSPLPKPEKAPFGSFLLSLGNPELTDSNLCLWICKGKIKREGNCPGSPNRGQCPLFLRFRVAPGAPAHPTGAPG